MKLTKAAEACISQAHMHRMSAGIHENLCVEHVFFGLLAMARYLDPPYSKPEYVEEGKAVRAVLTPKVRSIESASWQLRKYAKDPNAGYVDASAAIGRAAEMAENAGSDLTAAILAKAVLESPTPVILAVYAVLDPECAREDAKYQTAKPINGQSRPALEPKQQPARKSKEDNGPTASQLGALLALLAALENEQHNTLKQGANKQKGPKVKRRTRLGLFTYRGGTVAAFLQYFLFGSLVPFALLFVLKYYTGTLTEPATPFVGFLVNAFIVLWVFYLARGVNKLMGLIGKAFGHFLDLISDCLLLLGLSEAARLSYMLPETPSWMRVIVCVGSLVILLIGLALYRHLTDQGDVTKTKIMFQDVEGTPGMIFFRFLTKELIFPLTVFTVFWIFRIALSPWAEKVFYIYAFFFVWNVILVMWNCWALRFKSSYRRHRGHILVRFLGSQHIFLLLPGLTLYLHWLFKWFPIRTWVIVLYGIYGLVWLIMSIANLKQIKEDC